MIEKVVKRSRRKQCVGKIRHNSEKTAISYIYYRHGNEANKFNIYKCPHCASWHIGHKLIMPIKVEFHRVPPDNIQFLPFKAIKYIEEAIQRTPANVTQLDAVLDVISKGNGDLYLISKNDDIAGITYLVSYPTQEEKILGIILLGGDSIASWILDYRKFIRAYMDSAGINKLMFIGRKGWIKLFPDAQITGYVCEIVK